jgi:hypothetical protein
MLETPHRLSRPCELQLGFPHATQKFSRTLRRYRQDAALDDCRVGHRGLDYGHSRIAAWGSPGHRVCRARDLGASRSSFDLALSRPPLPLEITPFGRWADRAGRFAHWLLYGLLLSVIGAGIAGQFADGDALPVFGLFQIASPWAKHHQFAEAAEEIHEVLANARFI